MQKIYFGDVIIKNIRTGVSTTVEKKIYLENDTPPAHRLRLYVLKDIPNKEHEKYKIVQLCFESALMLGSTAY